ncbi:MULTISPECIES: phage tail fiber protein [Paenibacillus]|nr:hypothetical protein [Paenibacillus odorifer]OMC96202.1 hypothetical protein BJP49_10890 [Paenibacillus odorifer]
MAMQISNYLSAALLNAALRNTAFTGPATVYIALYKSDPTAADTGTEVSGGSYARQAVTFGAPTLVSGQQTVANTAEVVFPVATADWGLVTHIGLRTAATGGSLLWTKPLDNPRTLLVGDRPRFAVSSTSVKFTQ